MKVTEEWTNIQTNEQTNSDMKIVYAAAHFVCWGFNKVSKCVIQIDSYVLMLKIGMKGCKTFLKRGKLL